jgi:hypothetical protein
MVTLFCSWPERRSLTKLWEVRSNRMQINSRSLPENKNAIRTTPNYFPHPQLRSSCQWISDTDNRKKAVQTRTGEYKSFSICSLHVAF